MNKYQEVSFDNVSISEGFWSDKQRMNREHTIHAVYNRFKESGRFDAIEFSKTRAGEISPHVFWDSDVAKWIEAVAYITQKKRAPELEFIVDQLADLIVAQQEADGYFNSYFQTKEPENRFKKRTEHELYCAGHLIEAAVAYYEATKKGALLKALCRYADLIYKVFLVEKSAAFETPGHQELELALVRLYRCTGNTSYLELSKHFVAARGSGNEHDFYDFANARYSQDHKPILEQTTAEGHSVRAVYLYMAMADLAYEYQDNTMLTACQSLFDNMVKRRMYITGGIGSSKAGEAFTVDYDLPNLTAYSESCAAIGLMLFAQRMLKLYADSQYSNLIERILYNGFLSSVSLDGRSFFYLNPLEVTPWMRHRDVSTNNKSPLPIAQRAQVFDCSCCPPNISRMLASVGSLIYTQDGDTLYLHQYISNNLTLGNLSVQVHSELPLYGDITVHVHGSAKKQIAMRIPAWQQGWNLFVNGKAADPKVVAGYIYLTLDQPETIITLKLHFSPVFVEANPAIVEDCGKVALTYGPVVYCLEEVDNGPNLSNCYVEFSTCQFDSVVNPDMGFLQLSCQGYAKPAFTEDALYRPVEKRLIPRKLTFIPYSCFANRGETEMVVWLKSIIGITEK